MKKIDVIIDGTSFVSCYNNEIYLEKMIAKVNSMKMSIDITLTNKELHDDKTLSNLEKMGINTTSDKISLVIYEKIKNRSHDHVLAILSMANYALDVNKNNNSYYIYMDSFITDNISKKCLNLIDIKFDGVNLSRELEKKGKGDI